MAKSKKAFFYIDGYNFYFSLKQNSWKKYYWLDLVQLAMRMTRPGHFLSRVNYFTAPVRRPQEKKDRQQTFFKALRTLNFLSIHYGKYQYNTIKCFDCGRMISVPKEKKTDVNIASYLLMDAVRNECNVQYILSGDSDLTPPIKLLKKYYPEREIYLICPPKHVIPYEQFKSNGSKPLNRVSDDLIKICKGHQYINEKILKECLLPNPVINKYGEKISCPKEWK